MTLRRKLLLAFGAVLILVGLQAAVTVVLLTQVAERSAEMVTPALERVDYLEHIQSSLLRLRTVEYSLIVSEDLAFRRQLSEEIKQLEVAIGRAGDNYWAAIVEPVRASSFRRARQDYDDYVFSLERVQAAVNRGASEEALWQYLRYQQNFNALQARFHTLRDQETQSARAIRDNMVQLAVWSRWPLGLVVLVVAIAEVSLGWFVSRNVSRSLLVLRRGARRIASQVFDRPVPLPSEPELAALAETLNDVMGALGAHQRQAAELEEERIQLAHERVSQVVRAQERERARISRELHDQAGQALVALNHGLARLRRLFEPGPEAAEIDRLIALAGDTGRQIAALARDLRPGVLDDLGLIPALRTHIRNFSDRIGIPASLSVHGPVPRLSQEAETTVFRVVQEALTNAAKHAKAHQVTVNLSVHYGVLVVDVADDGRGFNAGGTSFGRPGQPGFTQTLGLAGIRERVQLLKGVFHLISEPGKGTRILVTIPLPVSLPFEERIGNAEGEANPSASEALSRAASA